MKKICIGIDISKDSFVSATPIVGKKNFKMQHHAYKTPQDIANFISTLNAEEHFCVMEATGVYHKRLAYSLVDAGISTCVANPASIKYYAKMKNSITKTDRKDAQNISIYGQEQEPLLYEKPTEEQDSLAQRRSLLNMLQKQLQMLKNQLESMLHQPQADEYVMQELKSQIQFLEKRIAALQEKIKEFVQTNNQEDYKLLLSVPAIGPVVATAFLDALSTFSGKELPNASKAFCKYLGLVPVIFESGKSVHKKQHIARSSVPSLRSKLFIATCAAIHRSTSKNPITPFFKKLFDDGKTYKQAILAAMHKVVRIAFAVLKNRTPFDPNFSPSK